MPLFDGIGDIISGVGDWLSENPMVGGIATAVVSGYALYKVTESTQSDQATTAKDTTTPASKSTASQIKQLPDPGTLIQVPPSQDKKIPVVYGRATVAGIITEAVQKDLNKKMVYVVTVSETTGNLMSSNFVTPSTFKLNQVFYNDRRVIFKSDGVTVSYITDRDGNVDIQPKDLIKIWFYSGGVTASNQVSPEGFTVSPVTATSLVPGWGGAQGMHNLNFAVVELTYNKDKNVTQLPNMTFTITNSLNQPGDVLCDFMTNTLYGAGIPIEDILTV